MGLQHSASHVLPKIWSRYTFGTYLRPIHSMVLEYVSILTSYFSPTGAYPKCIIQRIGGKKVRKAPYVIGKSWKIHGFLQFFPSNQSIEPTLWLIQSEVFMIFFVVKSQGFIMFGGSAPISPTSPCYRSWPLDSDCSESPAPAQSSRGRPG